jgi:hypothetical protein
MISVCTPSLLAIFNPFADGLFEITIVGLIGMFCFCTALSINFMLLPLPEIKIASLSNALFNSAHKIKLC